MFWCQCCILCNISLLLVWKNYGYNLEPGKIKDLYLSVNYHINQVPICVQIYSKHILTDSDTASKTDTKAATRKCEQIDYLNKFGLEYSIKSQFENAEKYLFAVFQKNSKSENFDELRYEQYIDKSKSLTELAPTSSSIEGHLSRCYYVVYNSINVLKVIELLDPVMYGCKSIHDSFLPEK